MRREPFTVIGVIWFLLTAPMQGQTALAIRAAATRPVFGWQQVASPDRSQIL
jgi:hypothetical protein